MQIINIKRIIGVFALFTVLGLALASTEVARADDYVPPPQLPPACSQLQVPAGNKLSFRVYAVGVQVYRWNGTSWDFVAPIANLYYDRDFHFQVGIHYAGPTWENNRGRVVAARLAGCSPDATAIPWLLLQKTSTEGRGIFSKVTFIQRVNTAGGLAPAAPGASIGAEARVPYTTEYYFYRAGY